MNRPPFFQIGATWFIDLRWNFGEGCITPTAEQWEQLVAATPQEKLVVGRALAPAEVRDFLAARADSDAETYAFTITNDGARWQAPKARRRGPGRTRR